MKFDRAIALLQEFDYERNGKDHTIDFLRYVVEELENYAENKKIKKIKRLNNISGADDLIAISQMQWENNLIIERKINEIIDKLNEEK